MKAFHQLNRSWPIWGAVALLCGLHAGSSLGDTIELKPNVRLASDARAITLGMIAELAGEQATRFAGVEIAPLGNAGVIELSVTTVREKLDAAGVNWAVVNLSGRKVVVRPARDGAATPPLAMSGASVESERARSNPGSGNDRTPDAGGPMATAQLWASQANLRGEIVRRIATGLHAEPKMLRIGFDGGDEDLLQSDLAAGGFEIEPASNFLSDRVVMNVRMWRDGRVQMRRSVSATVLINTKVAVARRDIERDQTLTDDDVMPQEQWLPPSQLNSVVTHVQAIGRVANRRLNAGEVLRDKSVQRQTLVKRGDQVMIRCLVGGVAIAMQAEARSDGSEGDSIEFRKQGEKQTFRATIVARGEAVVDLRTSDLQRAAAPATTGAS
jgi:flagella basal body P-ring formation protein FlgA